MHRACPPLRYINMVLGKFGRQSTDKANFCLQTRIEQERGLLTGQLAFLYGEDLLKESSRVDTLVNVLEFFYTQSSGEGDGTISIQVNEAEEPEFVRFVKLSLSVSM